MKRALLRCKKLCAAVLMFVMVFGVLFAAPKAVQAANTKYWIKVNKQANVATVYQLKGGKYKPIKAFLVSCGGSNTPSGTYYTPAKYRWHTLQGPSYGQYCTRIHGGILFHSVWYYAPNNKASQSTVQFNKLGTTASHGCVRLSVADAKWIYDNCSIGTKVTIYSSKNPGPLGKPKGIKVSTSRRMYWDPTDPDKKNPYRKKKAKITVSSKKKRTAEYGKSYSIRSGVAAKDQITKKSLTKKIKYSVTKYQKGKYRKAKFSTKSLGTYRIKYSVKSSLGATTTKQITVKVVDTLAPTIQAKNRTVKIYSSNAVSGVTAKMRSGTSRTSAVTVKIKAPGAKNYVTYSYAKAKAYKFTKSGKYSVQYIVKNKNKPYRSAKKTVTITVLGNAQINNSKVTVENGSSDADILKAVRSAVTVNDNGTVIKGTDTAKVQVTLVKGADNKVTGASVSYKGKNGVTVKKTVAVELRQPAVTTETKKITTEQPASVQQETTQQTVEE